MAISAAASLNSMLKPKHSRGTQIPSIHWEQSYRLVTSVDPHQEQGLGDEQANAEVLMDGVTVALQAAEEAEGEEADEEANQGEKDANPGDNIEKHVVNRVRVL